MSHYFSAPMRRASQAVVVSGVAAALTSSLTNDSQTIHAEEINDVARIIFPPSSASQPRSSLIRVSSSPDYNDAIIKLGARIASNPKIQQLVQEEVGEWLLVNSVPGGAPLPTLRTEFKDEENNFFNDANLTPDSPVRKEFAEELMKEIFSPVTQIDEEENEEKSPIHNNNQPPKSQKKQSTTEISPIQSQPSPNDISTSTSTSTTTTTTTSASVVELTLLDKVFEWIQQKLSGVSNLFHPSTTRPSIAQSQSKSESHINPAKENIAADNNSPPPSFVAGAVGVAAVLIVLVFCRRFSPTLFKSAIKLL